MITEKRLLDISWLDKLIAIHSRDSDCCQLIQKLVSQPNDFPRLLTRIEDLIKLTEEDDPLSIEKTDLTPDGYLLYKRVVNSSPLYRLFQSEPFFSKIQPAYLKELLEFADVHPVNTDLMLTSRDAVFTRILNEARKNYVLPTPDYLLLQDLTKLIYLKKKYPQIHNLLLQIFQDNNHHLQLKLIEESLENDGLPWDALSTVGKQVLELLKTSLDQQEKEHATQLFLQQPKFSSIVLETINLFVEHGDEVTSVPNPIEDTLYEQCARNAENLREKIVHTKEWCSVYPKLQLRIEAIDHFFELRKFAKIKALQYKWPGLAQQIQQNRSAVILLENYLLAPETIAEETHPLWQRYKNDENLMHFLQIRPLFRDIYPGELKRVLNVTSLTGTSISTSSSETLESQHIESPQTPPYASIAISIAADSERTGYISKISWADKTQELKMEATKSEVFSLIDSTQRIITYQSQFNVRSYRDVARTVNYPLEKIQHIGETMFELLFGNETIRNNVIQLLRESDRTRIELHLGSDVPELTFLPWEAMYIRSLRTFLGTSLRYSLVRRVVPLNKPASLSLPIPCKFLVISASPSELAPLRLEQENEAILRILNPYIETGKVEVQIINHATLPRLIQAMRTYQPTVFHFNGHATFDKRINQGAIIIEDERGSMRSVSADELKTLLDESNVRLAVLNGCDTGTPSLNDAVAGVASALVATGVPAVVATMRAIVDNAATLFAREYYRAFVEGFSVEEAMIEARKALYIEKWDWSAFALFSSQPSLSDLRMK